MSPASVEYSTAGITKTPSLTQHLGLFNQLHRVVIADSQKVNAMLPTMLQDVSDW